MPLVFAYGSLVAAGRPATLRGFHRTWGVAMDNTRAIPGYKVYADRRTGRRPSVHVAFLDLLARPGAEVGGVLLAVGDGDLQQLDRRERNYTRIDVTTAVTVPGTATAGRVTRHSFVAAPGTSDTVPGTVTGVRSSDTVPGGATRVGTVTGVRSSDAVPGTVEKVWTYVGTPAARRRREVAAADGRLVVQRDYLEAVRAGFAALGDGALAAFEASTDPPPGPVVDLLRIDLPAR